MTPSVVAGSGQRNYWRRRVENDRLIEAAAAIGIRLTIDPWIRVTAGYERISATLIALLVALTRR